MACTGGSFNAIMHPYSTICTSASRGRGAVGLGVILTSLFLFGFYVVFNIEWEFLLNN